MDFEFSDEQLMLRESVRRWVDRAYGFTKRREIARAGGFSMESWREMAALGLTGLLVPGALGGMDAGYVEALVVMEELGRGLVLEPFAPLALVTPVLLCKYSSEAMRLAWLPRIVGGEALMVLAHQERQTRYSPYPVATRAQIQGDGWSVSGVKSLVPVGDAVDSFVVPACLESGEGNNSRFGLFLVQRTAPGVRVRGYNTQDSARAGELTLANAPAELLVEPEFADAALDLAIDVGIAAVCAEATGAMERMLEETVSYMNIRKQFGVPIASFQALRHRVADVKMQIELARSMSYYATLMLDRDRSKRRQAVAQAKLQIGNSARFVGQQCVQLHGGIGMTEECAVSHYFKRLTLIEMAYGDTLHQLGKVADCMLPTAGVND